MPDEDDLRRSEVDDSEPDGFIQESFAVVSASAVHPTQTERQRP